MSRPKSNDKRTAILDAALRVFAERGNLSAPTSAISAAAGVAEGTLFTYFRSKDDLVNQLYLYVRAGFDRALIDYPYGADPQTRLRYVWDRLIDRHLAHPELLTVLVQLRNSGRLFKENEVPTVAIMESLSATRELVQGGKFHEAPVELMVLMVRGQCEAAVGYIQAHPEEEAISRELGFQMILNGLQGR
jgi:AcrR family transcriptional regulator